MKSVYLIIFIVGVLFTSLAQAELVDIKNDVRNTINYCDSYNPRFTSNCIKNEIKDMISEISPIEGSDIEFWFNEVQTCFSKKMYPNYGDSRLKGPNLINRHRRYVRRPTRNMKNRMAFKRTNCVVGKL